MLTSFAVSRASWEEFVQMFSDRMVWVRESGIWIVVCILFATLFSVIALYAVMRWHYRRGQSRWRLW